VTEQTNTGSPAAEASLAQLAESAPPGKQPIDVNGDPEIVLERVRRQLVKMQEQQTIAEPGKIGTTVFRNGELVRLGRDDEDEPMLVRYTKATMSELLAENLTFTRPGRNGHAVVDPPMLLVDKILSAPDLLRVPVVQQIVNAPIFGPNGELHTEPGLLREARVWYEPADGMKLAWPVPPAPTPEEIKTAIGWIGYLFHDFPFDTWADRTHAWALLLLPFIRPMIDGPTPLHVVEAPEPGTGKGLLVKAALTPALGYEIAAHPEPRDHEEWRKHIMAVLLRGKPVFFLDNVIDKLNAGVLSSALTERVMEDRILGASKTVAVPVRTMWVVTANNPRLSPEMARRGVRIRLDARIARPQTRTGFAEPDLLRWARENRGNLVWSALTLVRAWVARWVWKVEKDGTRTLVNRPGAAGGVPEKGSYPAWRDVVGGILSGVDHPASNGATVNLGDYMLGNDEAFWSAHREDDAEDVCQAVELWWNHLGGQKVTAADLDAAKVTVVSGQVPISIGTLLLGPDADQLSQAGRNREIGKRLRKLDRRIICDWRVVKEEGRANRTWYRLEKAQDAATG
jgi:putative DNA primase/helicase